MFLDPRPSLARARRQVRSDLAADPYLGYILLGTIVLCGFWLWHRIPSFATRDERDRLLDPLVAYARVLEDPSLESLRSGVAWGRAPFGATFYLFGLAVLPVVVWAILTGESSAITGLASPNDAFGYYEAWSSTPEWVWTASLLAVRASMLAFAVGSVYLTYRLGTTLDDRPTGRIAAVILLGTFGFLMIAHEGGEDMPALFFVLLALTLLVEYVETGTRRRFYHASLAGGAAIAFKLTAAPIVPVIVLAYILRAWQAPEPSGRALYDPRLFGGGAALGAAVILAGFPTLLVGEAELFLDRILHHAARRPNVLSGPDAPIWWWFLRNYASGLGLPVFLTVVLAIPAALWRAIRTRDGSTGLVIALGAGYIALFSGWHDFRVHHLLPTVPLLALLAAGPIERFRRDRPHIARPLLAVLVITGGVYAVLGVSGYASMPRDEATDWLSTNIDNESVEVYRSDFQDAAVPHGVDVRYEFTRRSDSERCPKYIELTYRDRLILHPGDRYPDHPAKTGYIRSLLTGEYNYTMVAAFGPQPAGLQPARQRPGSLRDALWAGLIPHSNYYSDEQELTPNQYTAIFERTGTCEARPSPPF